MTITPASGTEVEKLHQFTVSCTEGIGDAYSGQDIVLYNRGEFTAVAKVSNIEQIIPEDQMDNWDYVVQSLLLTLDTEITDAGAYVLDVPAGVFNLGTQFNQSHNAAFAANYTIKAGGSGSDANVEATPANGSTVKELSKVELVFPDEDEISIGSGLPTLSKDGGEPTKLNDAELDWDVYNKAILNFTPALTEAGVYTITFPEGYFLGTNGNALPGFSLTYTVCVQDGISQVQLSTSGNEAVYTISGLRVNPSRRLPAGTYIVGGKKVVVK